MLLNSFNSSKVSQKSKEEGQASASANKKGTLKKKKISRVDFNDRDIEDCIVESNEENYVGSFSLKKKQKDFVPEQINKDILKSS